ncbi:MAG TPA: trigger factor [Pyrinomonadaceae bacterium]|nr:trigger factor [Pyrinomonadaceae bacterium]
MKTELVDLSPTRKEIKIELEPELVRSKFDSISDRYAKQASVPGFRRGHAPRSVVRTRFKSEIRGEVLRELIPDAVNNAIEKHELAAIGEPDVHLDNSESLEQIGEGPISFHVGIEVFPTVELGTYKGLEAVRRVRPISDDDVTQMVDQLREASAALQPVEDRGAEMGDTVTVSFHGKFLDQPEGETPAEDINVADVEVTLGGPGVQQEFTDNLLGVSADDERSFTVNYPKDFNAKGLAGKKVEYNAKVSAVRRKELPELDDEWARSLGEDFDSVATLKTKVREDLERRAAAEADHQLNREVMKQLLAGHQFEVPQSFVDQQTNLRMESVVREMIGRGIDPRSQELNWESARDELKEQAVDDVRVSMLLERIAEAEQIHVSDDEIAAEIETIAQATRQPVEQVRATLTKEGGERSIAHRLRNRKALDLLIQNANVTNEEWKEEVSQETASGSQEAE